MLKFLDGMFAILLPATLAPLILSLVWAELKAKKLGLVEVQSTRIVYAI